MAASFPSDQSFIAALQERDIAAAQYFYDQYAPALYRVIICHAKNGNEAEKMLEKVMLYIRDHGDEFGRQDSRPLVWMAGIARRTAIAGIPLPKHTKIFKFKKVNLSKSQFPAWLHLPLIKK